MAQSSTAAATLSVAPILFLFAIPSGRRRRRRPPSPPAQMEKVCFSALRRPARPPPRHAPCSRSSSPPPPPLATCPCSGGRPDCGGSARTAGKDEEGRQADGPLLQDAQGKQAHSPDRTQLSLSFSAMERASQGKTRLGCFYRVLVPPDIIAEVL